jgi:large subunit ribosomal protein L13
MKSFVAKKEDVVRKWHIADADGQILGRFAVKIATVLMGKDKPIYTAHVDTGDCVVVINASKITVTGKKAETKEYDHYSGYPGGHKYVSYADLLERRPDEVIRKAVRRMLPKNKLGKGMLTKLKIYAGPEHEQAAQQPEPMSL